MEAKEAEFWVKKGTAIMCMLCPHACVLSEGEIGLCRVRKNNGEKLVSLVYGYPCALQIDPVEKKPLYHFLPGTLTFSTSTVGCNLRCLNCQNYHISQADFNLDRFEYVSPDELVNAAVKNNCKSISYTYTDPNVYYEYARDISILAKDKGLKNIIVSAGYINKKPLRELCKYIDAANIDLKCFDDKVYQRMSQVNLKPVLDTLNILKEENIWLEITNLLVPGYSDDIQMIKKMCQYLVNNGFEDVPLHFSRFHPAHKLSHLQPTSVHILNEAYRVAKNYGIKFVYIGNVMQAETNHTYCSKCGSILIERSGYRVVNGIEEAGVCKSCNALVPGVWELGMSCGE
ncbi:AmmeMemoRadiSam system radical SAM enzyme [Labilibacter sediminis]|nr:AmmeMemoRadiSam system radical SAM enzyme [Labilibacter sediminis]